jgi:hypothetical protein
LKQLHLVLVICLIFPLFMVNACSESLKPVKDNTLIQLMLTQEYEDGGYTIVRPETYHPYFELLDRTEQIEVFENSLKTYFKKFGITDSLVDLLFERNSRQYHLSLESAPEKGYLIDYDNRFEYYFDINNPEWQRGWEKLQEDYPEAHGITIVGMPAYDSGTGLVLAYVGWQYAYTGGQGYIILYKYENGQLIELNRVMIWIS